jgi:hypothetical protein
MPYHMPVNPGRPTRIPAGPLQIITYLNGNLPKLLDPIFSQVGKTKTNHFMYGLDCRRFGNDNKLHFPRISVGAGACAVDIIRNTLCPFSNLHHSETANIKNDLTKDKSTYSKYQSLDTFASTKADQARFLGFFHRPDSCSDNFKNLSVPV